MDISKTINDKKDRKIRLDFYRREEKKMNISKRKFVKGATAVAAFTIVPRHVLGGSGQTPPSEKLNIAGVGIGGKGATDVTSVPSENIVALCDVDFGHGSCPEILKKISKNQNI
jgi:hypothetical protein